MWSLYHYITVCLSFCLYSVSWRQYCDWRGIGLSSLVAPLLSSPLSIYYIITSLVPKHCKCLGLYVCVCVGLYVCLCVVDI